MSVSDHLGEDFDDEDPLIPVREVLAKMKAQLQPAEIRDGKRVHVLKSWPQWYERIRFGTLTSNVRKFDRDFKIGDWILFQEYDPDTKKFTGKFTAAEITDVLTGVVGIQDGYCVLSIKLPAGASGFSLDLQEK